MSKELPEAYADFKIHPSLPFAADKDGRIIRFSYNRWRRVKGFHTGGDAGLCARSGKGAITFQRIVMGCFFKVPGPGEVVIHADGNPYNNAFPNLRCLTRQEHFDHMHWEYLKTKL